MSSIMKDFLDKFFDLCREYQEELPPQKKAEVLKITQIGQMDKIIFTKRLKNKFQVRLEKKKYQKNAIALSPNIIPKNIYANFLPIKDVSSSGFTLIQHP